VVPFDDVDMVPESAALVLEAVRHLLASPYVVVLVAGDKHTFQVALTEDAARHLRKAGNGQVGRNEKHLERLAAAKMCKLLPQEHRVELRSLSPAERVDVLSGREALPTIHPEEKKYDALGCWYGDSYKGAEDNPKEMNRLPHLFSHDKHPFLGDNPEEANCTYPSIYADMLPETVRGVCQVRDALLSYHQQHKDKDEGIDLKWVKYFFGLILAHVPSLSDRDWFQHRVRFEYQGKKMVLFTDLSGLYFRSEPVWNWYSIPKGEKSRFGTMSRVRHRFYKLGDVEPVPDRLALLLFFTTELSTLIRKSTDSSLVLRNASIASPGGIAGYLMAIEARESSPGYEIPLLFLQPMPEWQRYSVHSLIETAWSKSDVNDTDTYLNFFKFKILPDVSAYADADNEITAGNSREKLEDLLKSCKLESCAKGKRALRDTWLVAQARGLDLDLAWDSRFMAFLWLTESADESCQQALTERRIRQNRHPEINETALPERFSKTEAEETVKDPKHTNTGGEPKPG